MKKTIIFIVCLALLFGVLTGCGNSTSAESAEAAPEATGEAEATEATGATEAEESASEPFELDTEERRGQYAYEASSLLLAEPDTDADTYYISENNEDGLLQVFYMEKPEIDLSDDAAVKQELEDTVATLASIDDASNLTTEYGLEIAGNPAVEFEYNFTTVNDETGTATGAMILDANGILCVIAAEPNSGEGRLLATVPSILESISIFEPEDDFLMEEDTRTQIYRWTHDFQFDEIIAMADAYIAEKSPAESDSVFAIKQAAEEANAVMPDCTLVEDEFEDDSILYGGVEEIGWDINFVPYIEGPQTYNVTADVGFKQDGWLFFENVKIKVGDDDYISGSFDYFDVQRDVISGGTILEEVEAKYSFDEVERILNAEDPVMRFTGEDDKTRDHEMTDAELGSLQNVYVVSKSMEAISDTIEQWTADNIR